MTHVFDNAGVLKEMIQKESLLIAGLEVYAHFHKDRPSPFSSKGADSPATLKVLYLLHGRMSSAKVIEELAHELLSKYYDYGASDIEPLVVISFDHRNHGKRMISSMNQLSWAKGNTTHAADMLSYIDGAVVDLKTIHDYLPAFIPSFEKFQIRYLVSGVSMGGHSTIRAVVKYPGLFDGAAPIVGCFDLSSLLLNRLGNFNKTGLYNEPYSSLNKSFEEVKYPRSLFDLVARDDALVAHTYDTKKLKTLALFGEQDPLVLLDYSIPFFTQHDTEAKPRKEFNPSAQFQAIKYQAKHETTEEMTIDLSKWLVEF